MEERSIHHSNGPGLHWIVHGHDFAIGVVVEVVIDVLCEIGSDEVVVSVLSEESDFTMVDVGERHIHIVFDCSNKSFGGCIDIQEDILKSNNAAITDAIDKCNSFIPEPNSIEASV
jgi:hypothetical protein